MALFCFSVHLGNRAQGLRKMAVAKGTARSKKGGNGYGGRYCDHLLRTCDCCRGSAFVFHRQGIPAVQEQVTPFSSKLTITTTNGEKPVVGRCRV